VLGTDVVALLADIRLDAASRAQGPLGVQIRFGADAIRTSPARGAEDQPLAEPADIVPPAADELEEQRVNPRSWTLPAPEGAYARVPVWSSKMAWFDALLDALAAPEGESARCAAKVDANTFLRVARADWLAADSRTGRGVATSHQTVATQLGMSAKTVKRCRDLLIALGFAVVIAEGRHLEAAERAEAKKLHGREQDRAASLRALTIPRPTAPVENVTPPRRGSVKSTSYSSEMVKHQRARARVAGNLPLKPSSRPAGAQNTAAARPSNDKSNPPPAPRGRTPWPRAQFEFAVELQRRVPSLHGQKAGTICLILQRAGIDTSRWTVSELLHAIDLSASARGGLTFASTSAQRTPVGYFLTVLRNSIDPAAQTPTELREAARKAALERQAAERARTQLEAARAVPAPAGWRQLPTPPESQPHEKAGANAAAVDAVAKQRALEEIAELHRRREAALPRLSPDSTQSPATT